MLIKIRSNEGVGVRLALIMTSLVPVSGWHRPELGSEPEYTDEGNDRRWLVFCMSYSVLFFAACTADERRYVPVCNWLVVDVCVMFLFIIWLHGRLPKWQRTTPVPRRNEKGQPGCRFYESVAVQAAVVPA